MQRTFNARIGGSSPSRTTIQGMVPEETSGRGFSDFSLHETNLAPHSGGIVILSVKKWYYKAIVVGVLIMGSAYILGECDMIGK